MVVTAAATAVPAAATMAAAAMPAAAMPAAAMTAAAMTAGYEARAARMPATTMAAAPSVPAEAATPAEATAVGIAAPIIAGALPAAIVPAEIASTENIELNVLQHRPVIAAIDAIVKLRQWRGVGKRGAQQQRERNGAQHKISHHGSFNEAPLGRRLSFSCMRTRLLPQRGGPGKVALMPRRQRRADRRSVARHDLQRQIGIARQPPRCAPFWTSCWKACPGEEGA